MPAYLALLETGELERRVRLAGEHLAHCDLCPWDCGADRKAGKLGVCRTGERARVSSYGPHLGEEAPLRGWLGSGTIFFARCNLRCQFCQNYEISQADTGEKLSPERLAGVMLELQELGCHNINLVSPSHVIPQILAAVWIAAEAGLHVPLVYNTGGYDAVPSLKLLEGVVDIYMPDMKYASAQIGLRYSKIRNYPSINREAVSEMYRQVGNLQLDRRGLAQRGLLVRHLIMPNNLAGTGEIVRFLAEEISRDTYLNLMRQYHPTYNARQYPQLNRQPNEREFRDAFQAAREAGLHRFADGE